MCAADARSVSDSQLSCSIDILAANKLDLVLLCVFCCCEELIFTKILGLTTSVIVALLDGHQDCGSSLHFRTTAGKRCAKRR